jgi:hypothetical protein
MNQMFSQAELKCVAGHNMESSDGKYRKLGSINTHKRHWTITGRREKVKVITVMTFEVLQGCCAMSTGKLLPTFWKITMPPSSGSGSQISGTTESSSKPPHSKFQSQM